MKNIILFSVLFSYGIFNFLFPFIEKKSTNDLQIAVLKKAEGVIKYKLYHGAPRDKNLEIDAKLSIKARFYSFKDDKLLCESFDTKKMPYGFYDYSKKKTLPNCISKSCKIVDIDSSDDRKYTIKKIGNENINGYNCEKYKVTSSHPTEKHIETQYVWTTQAFAKFNYYLPSQERFFSQTGMLIFNPKIKGFPVKIETPMYMEQFSFYTNPSDVLTVVYELEYFKEQKVDKSIFDKVIKLMDR